MGSTVKWFVLFLPLVCLELVAQTTNNVEINNPEFSSEERARIQSHGPWPLDTPQDPGNEFSGLAWAEELGEKLFHEKSLSGSGALSCASCHKAEHAFSDNVPLAIGAEVHFRNTQGLLDTGLQRWFGWDGGADSLWAAALRPMLSEIEMAGNITDIANWLRKNLVFRKLIATHVTDDFAKLTDETLVVMAAKSIAAFNRTLQSPPARFDLFREAIASENVESIQAYPAAAKRGLKLFLGDANCTVCHFGANFSNGEFHDTGRPFFTAVGQVDPGRYTGIQRVRTDRYNLLGTYSSNATEQQQRIVARVKLGQSNWGQWRTPSLRNLTLTAPYMHDGSIATLRGVIDAYADIDPDRLHAEGESILKPLNLSDDQRNDLVEFLNTLSP